MTTSEVGWSALAFSGMMGPGGDEAAGSSRVEADIMSADPLRTLLDDLGDDDSEVMREILESFRAGDSEREVVSRFGAGVAYRTIREIRPLIAGMVASGTPPTEIRRRVLGIFDDPSRFDPDNLPCLRAIAGRALDAVLGPPVEGVDH